MAVWPDCLQFPLVNRPVTGHRLNVMLGRKILGEAIVNR